MTVGYGSDQRLQIHTCGYFRELLSNNKLWYLTLIADIAKHNFSMMGEELYFFK